MQDESGPVPSSHPLYPSEPSISRFPIPLVFPLPHIAHNILEHIFQAEGISVNPATRVYLYNSFHLGSLGPNQHVDVQSENGPGSSILRPFICLNIKKIRRPPGWVTLRKKRED